MKILFFGTPVFAVSSLKQLLRSSHHVVGIVTQPDRPKGRGGTFSAPPIKEIAHKVSLPIFQPEDLSDPGFLESIRPLNAEYAVVVAYGAMLPLALRNLFPHGAVNLHASLLPKYRGAAPIQWALIRGEKETGLTVFQIDEMLDHGPIFVQARQEILPEDTAESLGKTLSELGGRILIEALDLCAQGKIRPVVQDESQVTRAPRLTKEDGLMDWNREAVEIHHWIRGVQPWPGAMTWWDRRMLKLFSTYTSSMRPGSGTASGTVVCADSSNGLWVQTGKGQLRIDRLQLEGGQILASADFLRGHPIPIGTVLGKAHA